MSSVPSRSTAPGRWRPTSCLTATVRNAEPPIAITTTAARPGSRRTTSQSSATTVRAADHDLAPGQGQRLGELGQRRRPDPQDLGGRDRVQPARAVVLAGGVGQPRHPPRGEDGDTGQDPGGARDPRPHGSAGSGRGPERASLHEPNLGRCRWSRNVNERPGQVVVRLWSGSGPVRSGAGQVQRARVGPHLPGTVAGEPIEGRAT